MFKAIDQWFPGYLRSLLVRPGPVTGTRHLIVCVCDHYEPFRDGVDVAAAHQTVHDWLAAYPGSVDSFRDADGMPPRHTFFYPQEEYDASILDSLAAFCRRGFGEVEIHLHHRHDTAEGFREKLVAFRNLLHEKHGLLGEEKIIEQKLAKSAKEENALPRRDGGGRGSPFDSAQGEEDVECAKRKLRGLFFGFPSMKGVAAFLARVLPNKKAATFASFHPSLSQPSSTSVVKSSSSAVRFAFIHGNWSLCNSRPDGDWCGVNEELGILAETGCYADFTFPSAPSSTQPKMVNAIYYAKDMPGRPRGADKGELSSCRVAGLLNERSQDSLSSCSTTQQRGNSTTVPLMLITGPLALNWRRRKWGILPRLENADISGTNPPTADRVRLWARQQIGVIGRPDWVFVKLHTHGCVPGNARVLLGSQMRVMHETLQREFNDGQHWQLHYVTAREMHNLVKAAEANLPGAPGQYRDTPISPPPLTPS
jgi:hypothetical protein